MKPEARRLLLEMAKRRAKAGTGSDLRVLREERSSYGRDARFPDQKFDVVNAVGHPDRIIIHRDICSILNRVRGIGPRIVRRAGVGAVRPGKELVGRNRGSDQKPETSDP